MHAVHACNPPDLLFLVGLMFRLTGGARFVFDHHDLVPELFRSRFGSRLPVLYWGGQEFSSGSPSRRQTR